MAGASTSFGDEPDFLKTYSLDLVVDVLLFLVFIVIIVQYIQKKRKNLK